jgi:hypothetical protein
MLKPDLPTGATLGRWCYENPNLAAAIIEGLRSGGRAINDIADERKRQIEVEGWTPEHDDAYSGGEMALAAACYATAPSMLRIEREWVPPDTPKNWPWHFSWWKPGLLRRNLVKAGALIVAEIERLDRADDHNI